MLLSLASVQAVEVTESGNHVSIENESLRLSYDLKSGTYSGLDLRSEITVFGGARFTVDETGWKQPQGSTRKWEATDLDDDFGKGKKLTLTETPKAGYRPIKARHISVYDNLPFAVLGFSVINHREIPARVTRVGILEKAGFLPKKELTDPGFQAHTLAMWTRLGKQGLEGIKFDYPESAWCKDGGFEDKSYTTTNAYRKVFELCRAGLGSKSYIHERNLGEYGTPRLDVTAGIADLQRVWGDSSHFEPEMASRMGLRWYKNRSVFGYYPDTLSYSGVANVVGGESFEIALANNGCLLGAVNTSSGEAAVEALKSGATRLTLKCPENSEVKWSVTWAKQSGE